MELGDRERRQAEHVLGENEVMKRSPANAKCFLLDRLFLLTYRSVRLIISYIKLKLQSVNYHFIRYIYAWIQYPDFNII